MAVFREQNSNAWIIDKVNVTNEETKETKTYRVVRGPSWEIMSKGQWDILKKEIDSLYEVTGENKIIALDEDVIINTQSPEHKKIKGYVYLIQADNGFIKIGRTIDIKNRFKTLSVQLPYQIKLLGLIETDDYIGLEENLHCKYSRKRANGEWFKLTEDELNELLKLVNV